jgi:hypothetical protein
MKRLTLADRIFECKKLNNLCVIASRGPPVAMKKIFSIIVDFNESYMIDSVSIHSSGKYDYKYGYDFGYKTRNLHNIYIFISFIFKTFFEYDLPYNPNNNEINYCRRNLKLHPDEKYLINYFTISKNPLTIYNDSIYMQFQIINLYKKKIFMVFSATEGWCTAFKMHIYDKYSITPRCKNAEYEEDYDYQSYFVENHFVDLMLINQKDILKLNYGRMCKEEADLLHKWLSENL